MTDAFSESIFALFLMFCRIGGCILLAPGLSSPRVPVNVRLFVAVGVTAALSPLMIVPLAKELDSVPKEQQPLLIFHEMLIGVSIGLMARCFLLALQFAATAISNFIGLSGIPGIPLEEGDTGSPLATLVSSAAVMIIFILGLHVELLKAVIDSYGVIALSSAFPVEPLLNNLLRTTGESWLLALRLAGPFLLYGVVVNFALGMGNRFAQQLSMYHATTGVVILGGFLLLYVMWIDWILVFIDAYRSWLAQGGF
ncbi:flagellar biosynthetic protein FliR [Aestuariivirga sp.]|uniref:flagellar biosynthetic protein FliR n=1 Tax=Aestuariivirga sp. TaxID=2650926 RepID=UPI003BAC373B